MRILITGAAGFIGTNMTKRLLEEGHSVTGTDNLYCSSERNYKQFLPNPNYTFIKHDIRDSLEDLFREPFDQIFNFACPASPPNYQRDPLYTLDTCTNGLVNVLELATKMHAKVLQASTSEIYGDPLEHPQKESYRGNVNIFGVRACYDEGKRVGETFCFNYNKSKNTRIKVIRIFNTYGPFMDPGDGRVISNMVMQGLRGGDITVFGDGNQTRSFQYIDDLIEGIIRVMATEDDFIGPINLGNPSEFTIKEFAELILEMTGNKSKIVRKDLPLDDPKKRKPDISLAKEKLDWEPKIELKNGLEKTIEYFRNLENL